MAAKLLHESGDVRVWETGAHLGELAELRIGDPDLQRHVALIQRQVDRSVADPELRQLAVKIVSNKADMYVPDPRSRREIPVVRAWGETFRLPQSARCAPDNADCEVVAIWDFAVLNVRYVLDPDGADFFATARYTLEAGGGDCDDFVILLAAMLKLIGFHHVAARIVSTNDSHWEHVYLMVGFPKNGRPKKWVALDPTVRGFLPGRQHQRIRHYQDFKL